MACGLAVLEAVALVLQGLLLLPALEGERLTMGLTSTLFFSMYGVGLAWCAWCLARGQSWARAPVVLAQLIQVLLGFGFWGGDTTAVAVVLVVVGLVVLAGVFHPRSLAALDHDGTPERAGTAAAWASPVAGPRGCGAGRPGCGSAAGRRASG